MGGENFRQKAARGIRPGAKPVNHDQARASQALLARIVELHTAGRNAEEIAAQVLTTEPDNVTFRATVLVEIILQQLHCEMEEISR